MRDEIAMKVSGKLRTTMPWYGRPKVCTNCGDDLTDMDEWYPIGKTPQGSAVVLCPKCMFSFLGFGKEKKE